MLHLKFKMKSNQTREKRKKEEKDENAINRDANELLCYAVFCLCAFVVRLRFTCSFFNWVHFNHFNSSMILLRIHIFFIAGSSLLNVMTFWVCFLFISNNHVFMLACLFVCLFATTNISNTNKLFKFIISIASVGWILIKMKCTLGFKPMVCVLLS